VVTRNTSSFDPLAEARRGPELRQAIYNYDSVVLRLSDLVLLPRPGAPGADLRSFEAECQRLGLNWPAPVVGQFLYDHGAKDEFLEQYDHLDLLALRWELRELPAGVLVGCTVFEEFADQVIETAAMPHHKIAQYREAYGPDLWSGSWRLPPVFLEGHLRNPPHERLHLVEGHTRLGILTGLLASDEVPSNSLHKIFVGAWI
jgi:hypothetical protein